MQVCAGCSETPGDSASFCGRVRSLVTETRQFLHDTSQAVSWPFSLIDRLYHHPLRKPVKRVAKRVISFGVIVASIAGALFLLFPPALSLSGDRVVNLGGSLHIHGEGFVPLDSVVLALDNSSSEEVFASTQSSILLASSITSAMQCELSSSWCETITVGSNGSFDASIFINERWNAGLHTIHATEIGPERTTAFSFKVLWPCKNTCVSNPHDTLSETIRSSSEHITTDRN
jgi:hypothetical protein